MTNNELLTRAIELIQNGEKAAAQRILEPYLQANPYDITAWLWEARTWSALEVRIKVLENCLTYNPENAQIQIVLAALETQRKHGTNQYMLCCAQRLKAI